MQTNGPSFQYPSKTKKCKVQVNQLFFYWIRVNRKFNCFQISFDCYASWMLLEREKQMFNYDGNVKSCSWGYWSRIFNIYSAGPQTQNTVLTNNNAALIIRQYCSFIVVWCLRILWMYSDARELILDLRDLTSNSLNSPTRIRADKCVAWNTEGSWVVLDTLSIYWCWRCWQEIMLMTGSN